MSQPLWQQLTHLVSLEKEHAQIDKQHALIETQIKEKRARIAEQSDAASVQREQVRTLKKQIAALELRSKELDVQEAAKKETLAQVSGQKEFVALEKELAVLALARNDQEEALLAAWHDHEAAEKKIRAVQKDSEGNLTTLEGEIVTLKEAIVKLEADRKKLITQEAEAVAALPNDWKVRYEKMKGKIANPVVPLLASSCSACFYPTLPKDLDRIRKGDVLNCRSCYRFLYHSQEAVSGEEEAS